MTKKIGSLMIDIAGLELTPEDADVLSHPLVGGVILFTCNYETREQLKRLCQQIRATRTQPLLIMVDQEGGRVQRFRNEFTRLPPMAYFGELYDSHPQQALQLARKHGHLMATELLTVGVDISLAPVLDLRNAISEAIGDRAFHANPAIVIILANAFIAGMRLAGMAATGKHFPGHGSIKQDSHVTLPNDERTLADLEKTDLIPFAALIKQGITAMMAAHLRFPQIDQQAISFSPYWLQTILRKKLGFNGVIMSDDLHMEGANISSHYADRVLAAREAGCDFTLVCNHRSGVINVLDQVPASAHLIDIEKWGKLQGQGKEKI